MKNTKNNMKKGQTTLFIIIAIVIVALGVLIYVFYPQIRGIVVGSEESPYEYIQNCLQEDLKETVDLLSLQGGSVNPEHYIVYNGENIEYLCYTNEYYKMCTMQKPLLEGYIEEEITKAVKNKADECFNSMRDNFENKGYNVALKKAGMEVELLPKRIVVRFNHSLTLVKEDTNNYNSFKVILNNNLYELLGITNSILNWEARYGDAETTTYMNYYHDLKVEKKKQMDGSTIYILTDRNTQNKFQFASRSAAWPPGYG